MYIIHVHDLTFISGGGTDGGGVTGQKDAKPVNSTRDCVSSFVNVTPLGIFKATSGQFPNVFVVTKN